MDFIEELSLAYAQNASAENATPMEKYMKSLFTFHGIKTEVRRVLHKQAAENHKEELKKKSPRNCP